MLAPATKNIVTAVAATTIVVPRSGSRKIRMMTGAAMTRNGMVPFQNEPTRVPRPASQWAR